MNPEAAQATSLEEAQAKVTSTVSVLGVEEVALEAAAGRVLRQDVVCDIDYPSEDMSAMDGYAVVSAATRSATAADPVRLRIAGLVKAGELSSLAIGQAECVSIMTGAALPRGCDAVVRSEDVEALDGFISLAKPVAAFSYVRRCGEVARKGARLNLAGERVTPALAGLLATFGAGRVAVARRPRVGVLVTGDEVVGFDSLPLPGHLRNSNGPMLAALVGATGCAVESVSLGRDNLEDLARRFEVLGTCDAVVVSGGVAGGEFDLVPRALEAIGAEFGFSAVRMRPGKRLTFATLAGTAFYCLPGNPGGALVGFTMIARAGLLKAMGARQVLPRAVKAITTSGIESPRGFSRLVFARLTGAAPSLFVDPLKSRGSGDVVSLARADCLIWLREDCGPVSPGEAVDVILL